MQTEVRLDSRRFQFLTSAFTTSSHFHWPAWPEARFPESDNESSIQMQNLPEIT